MGIIEDTYTSAIALMNTVGQTQYALLASGLAGTGAILMQLLAVLALLSAASGRTALGWMDAIKLIVVFVLVASFLKNWSQFNSIFLALNSFFDGITTSMLQGAIGGGNLAPTFAGSLDDMMVRAGEATSGAVGRLDISGAFLAAIVWLILALFSAVCIVALILSKAALLVFVAVAPAAILCVLSDKTKNFFETWLSGLIKFLMFPVVLATVLSLSIRMIGQSLINVSAEEAVSYGAIIGVGTGLVTGIVLVLVSPVIVQELTGSLGLGSIAGRISGAMAGAGAAAAKVAWRGTDKTKPEDRNPAGGIKGIGQDLKRAYTGEGGIGGSLRGGADIRVGQMNRMAARVARFTKK